MISKTTILQIHSVLIEKFGGSDGIRDINLLESAIARPYASFNAIDLYPTPIEKAAAIIQSLVNNHPFIDGNKRTAYVAMRLLLLEYQLDIEASEDEKYDFVISIASSRIDLENINDWIKNKLISNINK